MAVTTLTFEDGVDGQGQPSGFTNSQPTLVYSDDQAMQGTLSAANLALADATGFGWLDFVDGKAEVIAYVYITADAAADFNFLAIRAGTSDNNYARLSTTSLLRLVTKGTVRWTASAKFPINQWVRVGLYVEAGTSPTTGKARLAYYLGNSATPVGDSGLISGIDTAASAAAFARFLIGKQSNAIYNGNAYYDMVQLRAGADATGAFAAIAATPAAVVTPNALVANSGAWAATGGTIPAVLADSTDATYIQNPGDVDAESVVVGLGALEAGAVTLTVRAALAPGETASPLRAEVRQGSTVVASFDVDPATTTPTDYVFTLSSAQLANVTDRTILRVALIAN